jgi:deoxyribose-phosphate aldolase
MSPVDDARRLIELLDLTELGDACRSGDVAALVRRGRDRVAALCVWPQFVGDTRRALGSAATAVATVINFPSGGEDVERAVADAREAVRDGAREIDLVMPWRAVLAGREDVAAAMIAAVRAHLPDNVVLKVILETGELASAPMIRRAAEIAIAAGADFLKTSTGKTPTGATLFAGRRLSGARRGNHGQGLGQPLDLPHRREPAAGDIGADDGAQPADARAALKRASRRALVMSPAPATRMRLRAAASGSLTTCM